MENLVDVLIGLIDANPVLIIVCCLMLAAFLMFVEIKRNYKKRIN